MVAPLLAGLVRQAQVREAVPLAADDDNTRTCHLFDGVDELAAQPAPVPVQLS